MHALDFIKSIRIKEVNKNKVHPMFVSVLWRAGSNKTIIKYIVWKKKQNMLNTGECKLNKLSIIFGVINAQQSRLQLTQ